MADKMPVNEFAPEVMPVSAEDVQTGRIGNAPPSYEEVIGQYETSVKTHSQTLPSLAFIDIMPRLLSEGDRSCGVPPTFQNFQDIMSGANMWLAANPNLQVWKCETVERKVNRKFRQSGQPVMVDLQSMLLRESAFVSNCYVLGLRMWLCQRFPGQTGVQQLGLINIVPSVSSSGSPNYSSLNFAYKGIKESISDFNRNLQSNPIPGTILSIESTTMTYFQHGFTPYGLEAVANSGSWYDGQGYGCKRLTQILRVFFVLGPHTKTEIKTKEFLPELTHVPQNSLDDPAFGHFEGIVAKARDWLCMQSPQGIRIINMETRDGNVKQDFNAVKIDTDRTDNTIIGAAEVRKARFLRVFYVEDEACPSMSQSCLSSKLFMPICLGGKNHETMTQTMDRVDAWVKAVGLPIVSVETYYYQRRGSGKVDESRSDFVVRDITGEEWLATIRVYFASRYEEPPPSLLPPPPPRNNTKKSGSSSCGIL